MRIFCIILLFATSCDLLAQVPVPDKMELEQSLQKSTFKVNMFGLGLGGEFSLQRQQSVYVEIGCSAVLDNQLVYGPGGQTTNNIRLIPLPYASAEYRFYYNVEKRAFKGLPTKGFCGNYSGLFGRRVLISTYDIDLWNFAAIWGMQRRLFDLVFMDVQLGPSIYMAADETIFLPHVKFALGFSFQRNNK